MLTLITIIITITTTTTTSSGGLLMENFPVTLGLGLLSIPSGP